MRISASGPNKLWVIGLFIPLLLFLAPVLYAGDKEKLSKLPVSEADSLRYDSLMTRKQNYELQIRLLQAQWEKDYAMNSEMFRKHYNLSLDEIEKKEDGFYTKGSKK